MDFKKDQLFSIVCPNCKRERKLKYKAYWYVTSVHSKGYCKKCSPKNLNGLKQNPAWNKGLLGYNKGHKPYIIARGEKNPFFGKKHTKEALVKMSNAKKNLHDEQTSRWKGDDVGYGGLHAWVYKHKGKANKCEHCNTVTAKKYEWANLSREYKRDLNDWIELCKSCHNKFDNVGYKSWETRRMKYGQV